MTDQKKNIRKIFLFTQEMADQLNEYRFARRHKTEVDALRELLDIAFAEVKVRSEKLR